jgi:ribosomal protein S18 acetylase RimI-like enzyme
MNVVKAGPEHVHDVISLLEKFDNEITSRFGMGYNRESAELSFFLTVNSQERILLLLIDSEKVVGCLGGMFIRHFLNMDCTIFYESIWYVLPDYRGNSGAIKLIKEIEKISKAMGISKAVVNTTSANDDYVGNLYKRMGYKVLETHYIKDLKDG